MEVSNTFLESVLAFNKGNKYLDKKDGEKAASFYKKSIKLAPSKEGYLNLGNAYKMLARDKEAMECYKQSLSKNVPFQGSVKFQDGYDLGYSNLGLMYYVHGKDDEAIAMYEKALKLNPNHNDSVWNMACATLRKACTRESVDLEKAWLMYDFRFQRAKPTPLDRSLNVFWNGVYDADSICVLAEQGFGDKLMFGRYLKDLKKHFKRIVVQCPPEMDEIFSDYEICRVAKDSGCDVAFPICSLASIFGINDCGDWLRGKFEGVSRNPHELHIAVEWQGSSTHANDAFRSVPAGYFEKLRMPGVKFYNLNPKSDRKLKNCEYIDVKSWGDSARALASMDLVISIDTSIVHLAGSVGIETWMMQPLKETDFRWGRDSMGMENVWYKNVKVFRNPNSWETVFKNIRSELEKRKLDIISQKVVKCLMSQEQV